MNENQDLLDDDFIEKGSDSSYVTPDKGKRFINYFVDSIVVWLTLFLLTMLYIFSQPDDQYYGGGVDEDLTINLLSYIGFPLMYALMEFFTKGKSVGKFITKTKVVRRQGGEFTFLRALGRSFCRMIPFEAFSILMNDNNIMWHDSISDTMVVMDD